jgi:hypothetical protein
VESDSDRPYGLLWIGLGITVVGVASYLFSDPHHKSPSSTQAQHQDDITDQAKQLEAEQKIRTERNQLTNWLGIAAMTTGCMLWLSSKRHIPFSLLIATGLNLFNSWHAIEVDDEAKQSTDTDNNVDQAMPDVQATVQTQQFASSLYSH